MAHRTVTRLIGLSLAIGCMVTGTPTQARPAHKQAMADYFGAYLPAKLNACTTCHVAAKPTDEDHEHNAFGKRLVSVREELKKAGKKTDIGSRILAIADEDSDGDGVANILELLSGHQPGNATDKPGGPELAAARAALASLRAAKAGYAWKPFDTVQRPAVPVAGASGWSRNAIDAFLAAE